MDDSGKSTMQGLEIRLQQIERVLTLVVEKVGVEQYEEHKDTSLAKSRTRHSKRWSDETRSS